MPSPLVFSLIPDITCVAVCGIAAVWDLRTRRIPNVLTLPALALGLAMSFVLPAVQHGLFQGLTTGLLPSFFGGLLLFLSFLAFFAARGVGMGDVKLMAAVGAFVRWPLALWTLAFVLFAGALLSFIYAIRIGKLGAVFGNMKKGALKLIAGKGDTAPITLHHMPYGLGIFIGVSAAVIYRYWPVLF